MYEFMEHSIMDHTSSRLINGELTAYFWRLKAIHELVCGEKGILIFTESQILNKISLRFSLVICAMYQSFIDNFCLLASRYEYYICIF